MTGEQIIYRAWDMVGDIGSPKRNSITNMTLYLNDGIRDLISRRPHFALTADGQRSILDDLESGSISDELSLEPWLKEPLAHYIAFRVFEIDAEDEFNMNQSKQHYAQYLRTT